MPRLTLAVKERTIRTNLRTIRLASEVKSGIGDVRQGKCLVVVYFPGNRSQIKEKAEEERWDERNEKGEWVWCGCGPASLTTTWVESDKVKTMFRLKLNR